MRPTRPLAVPVETSMMPSSPIAQVHSMTVIGLAGKVFRKIWEHNKIEDTKIAKDLTPDGNNSHTHTLDWPSISKWGKHDLGECLWPLILD